jgi:ABC-2 type transport system permease protein
VRVIDLALKDLLQIARDWKTALFMVIMPIVFTLFFGFVFGSTGEEDDPRLPVGFVDHDPGGALSSDLEDLLEVSGAIRPVVLEGDEIERAGEMVRDETLAAVVIVPAGYGERTLFGSEVAAGEESELTVITDQTSRASHMAGNAVQAAVMRLMGATRIAQISARTFEEAFEGGGGFESEAARRAYLDEALTLASEAWRYPPLAIVVEQTGRGAAEGEDRESTSPFAQSSPGMIVMFVVLGLMTSAMVLVLERKSRALMRLLTTPITRAEVIGGHVLAMFVVILVQETLLVAVGQLAFGVDYVREPLGTLLMMVTLALWAASLGLLIGALARVEDQVVTWSLIAMFVFAAMGGAWFPLELTGQAFSTIGHLMPTAWAMDGFQNIVLRGLGLGSVLLPATVLLAFAAAFFGLAVWRFRFE